jgi:hypothetical protein
MAYLKVGCPDCNGMKDIRAERCKACAAKRRRGSKDSPETVEKKRLAAIRRGKVGAQVPGRKQKDSQIANRLISRYGYDTRKVGKTYDHKKHRWHLKAWADDVKASWNNKCASCESTEKLHAHHIIPKHLFPENELLVQNGICLCHDCHWQLHRHLSGKEV